MRKKLVPGNVVAIDGGAADVNPARRTDGIFRQILASYRSSGIGVFIFSLVYIHLVLLRWLLYSSPCCAF